MGANGRNSGESDRKLEGGDSETPQLPPPVQATKASEGGLHPAVYIAYVTKSVVLNKID